MKGNLGKSSDSDWYSFTLSKAGYVYVNFQHPQLEAVVGCWRIALHDTEAKELYSLPSYGDVKSTSSVKMGLPAGTYYVKISSGSSWKTSIYTVKVNYTETWMALFILFLSTL